MNVQSLMVGRPGLDSGALGLKSTHGLFEDIALVNEVVELLTKRVVAVDVVYLNRTGV